jgi:ankyrin repeat protein
MTKEAANKQLFRAATKGDLSAARAAIDAGADVNAKDDQRQTLLHRTIEHGQLRVALLLLEKGADVHAVEDYLAMLRRMPHGSSGMDISVVLSEEIRKHAKHTDRLRKQGDKSGGHEIGG